MEQYQSSFNERIEHLSHSVERYDKLLNDDGIERSRLPMIQTILALADTIAVGWKDYEKSKELANQAVQIVQQSSNVTGRLVAAALSKSIDRVKMFSRLFESNGTASENDARITYLTSQRNMMADIFVGDIGDLFLKQ